LLPDLRQKRFDLSTHHLLGHLKLGHSPKCDHHGTQLPQIAAAVLTHEEMQTYREALP
jgi:hypothetical protein